MSVMTEDGCWTLPEEEEEEDEPYRNFSYVNAQSSDHGIMTPIGTSRMLMRSETSIYANMGRCEIP
jgi:hypothetical protein